MVKTGLKILWPFWVGIANPDQPRFTFLKTKTLTAILPAKSALITSGLKGYGFHRMIFIDNKFANEFRQLREGFSAGGDEFLFQSIVSK